MPLKISATYIILRTRRERFTGNTREHFIHTPVGVAQEGMNNIRVDFQVNPGSKHLLLWKYTRACLAGQRRELERSPLQSQRAAHATTKLLIASRCERGSMYVSQRYNCTV